MVNWKKVILAGTLLSLCGCFIAIGANERSDTFLWPQVSFTIGNGNFSVIQIGDPFSSTDVAEAVFTDDQSVYEYEGPAGCTKLELNVDLLASSQICLVSGEELSVSVYLLDGDTGRMPSVSKSIDGQTWEVDIDQGRHADSSDLSGFYEGSGYMVNVSIPAGFERFEVNAQNSVLVMDSIQAENGSVDLNTGDCTVNDCTFGKLECDMNAGMISLTNVEADHVSLSVDSGDISAVLLNVASKLEAEINAGSLNLEDMMGDPNDYRYDLENARGTIWFNDEIYNRQEWKTSSTKKSIEAEVNAGDISISFSDRKK